ncbi:MAG: hypothetical protein M1377_02630 [Deltaproteobacteria bacterium]|nr:hypothetical protein [Deltaproteobacteria bacterium]
MDKHLLHELVEKVLLFWDGAFFHHLLEVVDDALEHLLVDRREFQPFTPGFQRSLLALEFLHPGP